MSVRTTVHCDLFGCRSWHLVSAAEKPTTWIMVDAVDQKQQLDFCCVEHYDRWARWSRGETA